MYDEGLVVGREANCDRCNSLFYTYDNYGASICGECHDLSRRQKRQEMLDMVNFLTKT